MADFLFNTVLNDDYHIKMGSDPTGHFFTNAAAFFNHLHSIGQTSCKNVTYALGGVSRYDPGYCYTVEIGSPGMRVKPYFAVHDGFEFPFGVGDPNSNPGSCTSSIYFSFEQPLHKFVLYVQLTKMTDISAPYRQVAIPPLEVERGLYIPDMGFGGSYNNNELSNDNFDDYYTVSSTTYYINDNDGKYNELNQRTAYKLKNGNYLATFVPYQVHNYKRNDKLYEGIFAAGITIENILGLHPFGTVQTIGVNYSNGIGANLCGYPNKTYYENEQGLLKGDFQNLAGRYDIKKRIYFKKETIEKILNDFGITYSFDINEILNNNTDNFSDYTPTGRPQNPTYPESGDGDNHSDLFESVTPSISPYDTYTTTYLCTKSDINKVSNYIWSDNFINNVIRLYENPAELITNNVFFPFSLTEGQTLGAPEQVKIGNVNAPTDTTGIPAGQNYNRRRSTPYYEYTSYFGNFLDYDPYSKYFLYLPYIGFVDINGNDVIKHQIHIEYVFELETGDCTAFFYSDDRLVSQFNGRLGTPVGLSNSNQIMKNLGMAQGVIKTSVGIASAIASKGAGGSGEIVSGINDFVSSFSEQTINTGDKVGGLNALYGPQDVFLIVLHAVPAEAKNLKEIFGKSASYGGTVADFSGFLQCSAVDGYTKGTDDENNEIFELLRGGIYV